MARRIPFSRTVMDGEDRTVILHGESVRLALAFGPVGFVWEYARPTAVEDRRAGRITRHRIPDVLMGLRLVAIVVGIAFALSRRRRS